MTIPLKNVNTIHEYIGMFPEDVQVKLNKLRGVILKAAPEASESIKYQMPTFALFGNLVHFAAYKKHIGFYPTPSGIKAYEKELSSFVTSKGAIQFPLDKQMPYDLVNKIVRFRVEENLKKKAL
ncbi:MAG: iron chaperone [Candidatus Dojkabacteria bacterium]